MFAIYTLGGVAGFVVSYLAGVQLTIGASAGVCGLVGATLYYGKSRGGVYGSAIYKQVGMWVIIMFVFGLLAPGINNWGHGGRYRWPAPLLGYLLGYHERKRETAVQRPSRPPASSSPPPFLRGRSVPGFITGSVKLEFGDSGSGVPQGAQSSGVQATERKPTARFALP